MEFKNISLIKYRNKLINTGLIVLALMIGRNIYSSQVKNIDTLKADKEIELKKNVFINDIIRVEKRINSYKKLLYKRDIDSIINSVTQIASSSQIKITSVRPEREKEYPAYNKISVRLSIVATDYHRIGDFISRLETAPELYIIDNFSITPLFRTTEVGEGDRLSAELTVVAIIFKD